MKKDDESSSLVAGLTSDDDTLYGAISISPISQVTTNTEVPYYPVYIERIRPIESPKFAKASSNWSDREERSGFKTFCEMIFGCCKRSKDDSLQTFER
jgi:hypothetical protein